MKTEMKWAIAICFSVLALFSTAQVLNQRVNLDARNITVEQALSQLSAQYKINFSYANNLLPAKKIDVRLHQVPLSVALDRILYGTGLTYQVVGEQIVIKKAAADNGASGANSPAVNPDSLRHTAGPITPESEVLPPMPEASMQEESYASQEQLDQAYREEKHKMRRYYEQNIDSISTPEGKKTFKQQFRKSMSSLHQEYLMRKDSLANGWQGFKARHFAPKDSVQAVPVSQADSLRTDTTASVAQTDTGYYKHDNFQFTVFPPLGTHGELAPRYINEWSVNLFVGNNGGVRYFEYATIANIIQGDMMGVQFSGLTNVVTGKMNCVQISTVNVVTNQVEGAQFSGIASVNTEDVWGGQVSGIASIAGDTVNGVQVSGIASYAPANVYGVQLSGVVNVCENQLHGAQIGLVNYARQTRGTQIGLINVTDSIRGVPVGLFSYVKKGYHHPELYYGETMTTNLAFKSGVRAFHNILYGGFQWEKNGYYRWAMGYGLGSEVGLGKRAALNFDVIGMHISENEAFTNELNFLGQFRMNLGIGLSRTIYLFAGPTFNTMISQYRQDNGELGSGLIPTSNLIASDTFVAGNGLPTKVAMWIGFNAGIRF